MLDIDSEALKILEEPPSDSMMRYKKPKRTPEQRSLQGAREQFEIKNRGVEVVNAEIVKKTLFEKNPDLKIILYVGLSAIGIVFVLPVVVILLLTALSAL